MPRRGPAETDRDWVEWILAIKGQDERLGAGRIHKELLKRARKQGLRVDISQRTISRILEREWATKKEDEKAQYRLVRWPESMGSPDLPWESSPAVLELMAYLDINGVRQRPPVRFAKWFWRVTQAAPQARKLFRVVAAADLARKESKGEPFDRAIEWWLAYMQISDDAERKRLYDEARARLPEDDPIPSLSLRFQASTEDGADLGFYMELLFALGFGIKAQKMEEEEA